LTSDSLYSSSTTIDDDYTPMLLTMTYQSQITCPFDDTKSLSLTYLFECSADDSDLSTIELAP